jgi:glycosyltransferase involved in cell wall biosynthesis
MNILIIQKNTGKAGAQNSLRRLLSTQAFKEHNVVVITGMDGWFVEQMKSLCIPVLSVKFPGVRSLYGKTIGNKLWTHTVVKALKEHGYIPDILQANNHMEVPFLKLLKKKYVNAKTAVFLRDGYIKKAGYIKYGCHECDFKIAVSQTMANIVSWDENIIVINNGVFENEVFPDNKFKADFPRRWLVVGNPKPGKGWLDFLSALRLIENARLAHVERIVFTGKPEGDLKKSYEIACGEFKDKLHIDFIEPYENLGQACQDFDVVVSPSRKESFGMAMLEAYSSGKCVIASRTGVSESLILNSNLLFNPGDVFQLSDCLNYVLTKWDDIAPTSSEELNVVSQRFSVEGNANKIILLYGSDQ